MMDDRIDKLLEEFMKWGERLRPRVAPDVKFELELGPPYDKRSASITFIGSLNMGHIAIWDSGEHEFYFDDIETGTISDFVYGETIEPSQFEQIFNPVTRKYLV
jgi:hypothetical protein